MSLATHDHAHPQTPALEAPAASILERSAGERLLMAAAALVVLGLGVAWALL